MNKFSTALAILVALIAFYYFRLRTDDTVQESSTTEERASKAKIEEFVSKVEPPKTQAQAQCENDDFGMDNGQFEDILNVQKCSDECGNMEEIFTEYWKAKNEFDFNKFRLKFQEPFTTNDVDYVEIVMKSNEISDEVKKTLWKSEISDKTRSREEIEWELKELFEMRKTLVRITENMKLLRNDNCMPCIRTTSFDLMNEDELTELNAFVTVLKYAKK